MEARRRTSAADTSRADATSVAAFVQPGERAARRKKLPGADVADDVFDHHIGAVDDQARSQIAPRLIKLRKCPAAACQGAAKHHRGGMTRATISAARAVAEAGE